MDYNLDNIIYAFNINDLIILEYLKRNNKRIINLIKALIGSKLIDNYNRNKV